MLDSANVYLHEDAANLMSLTLYVAKYANFSISAGFVSLTVDGQLVDPFNRFELASNQGFYVPLGNFEKGKTIVIDWELRIGLIKQPFGATIGVLRNGMPSMNTPLRKIQIESFAKYTELSSLKV